MVDICRQITTYVLMQDFEVIQHVLKIVRERQEDLASQLITGSVENWEIYQNIVGQLQSLSYVESEVKSIMNIMDGNDGYRVSVS